ncbi:hypothetical protein RRG08_066987 [Elysia crispata]|uniref:Uncharacterized protein n=1 Tax=Elysia crispata TaxID=231223 RepID=A0AAE0Z9Y2_9GAST|nr:hypothetical protein RRG08_066987 [Elysia crispata]
MGISLSHCFRACSREISSCPVIITGFLVVFACRGVTYMTLCVLITVGEKRERLSGKRQRIVTVVVRRRSLEELLSPAPEPQGEPVKATRRGPEGNIKELSPLAFRPVNHEPRQSADRPGATPVLTRLCNWTRILAFTVKSRVG